MRPEAPPPAVRVRRRGAYRAMTHEDPPPIGPMMGGIGPEVMGLVETKGEMVAPQESIHEQVTSPRSTFPHRQRRK